MAASVSTDLHRVFVQTLFSRRTIPAPTALELYKRACLALEDVKSNFTAPFEADDEGFNSFISQINDSLASLGFEVKRWREESEVGLTWFSLVNVEGNFDRPELGQQVSDLSPLEINYYREIISSIISSYPANSISSMQALSIAGKLDPPIPKTTAEHFLGSLVSRQWLNQSKRYRYSLAPRALAELDGWLRQEYGNEEEEEEEEGLLKYCSLRRCGKMVFQGWKCVNQDCNSHVHLYCRSTLINVRRDACPICKTPWSGPEGIPPDAVGEGAVERRDDQTARLPRLKKRSNGNRGEVREGEEDESEEGDVELEEDELDAESLERPSTQRVTRARTSRHQPNYSIR